MAPRELLEEAAAEVGLDHAAIPPVERIGHGDLSLLRWGSADPELVLLHGGGQNAHTWDLVALLLGRPLVAVDLPGHGHSAWREDRDYGPVRSAEAIAAAIADVAPSARAVVGMSLGGMTTFRLASTHPELVRRAIVVDVTPGTGHAVQGLTREQQGAVALTRGPREFDSLDEMVALAVAASPNRPASAVRRGVVHNTRQRPDGRWVWRYDLGDGASVGGLRSLWDDVSALSMPLMLVRGGASHFVTEDDVAELCRRQPGVRVEVVDGAGHSVQSDRPHELVALIQDFVVG